MNSCVLQSIRHSVTFLFSSFPNYLTLSCKKCNFFHVTHAGLRPWKPPGVSIVARTVTRSRSAQSHVIMMQSAMLARCTIAQGEIQPTVHELDIIRKLLANLMICVQEF